MPTAEHGNPAIRLPGARAGIGCATVAEAAGGAVVWTSHGVIAGRQTVCVNVWDGRFVGAARGWAVLPPGNYRVAWQPERGAAEPLGQIEVAPQGLFDERFDPGPSARENSIGPWLESAIRLDAQRTAACSFRQGAMHGRLGGVFEPAGALRPDARWGLVARHYNAFHHLRVACSLSEDSWSLRLIRFANEPPDLLSHRILAEKTLPGRPAFPLELIWDLNGDHHAISVNGIPVLEARDGYMGGVEIVGAYQDGDCIRCARAWMESTQPVSRHNLQRPEYTASIRPGNIDRLFLTRSAAPAQDLAWESGIQFGHIGGSEVKFTQGGSLAILDDGPVATVVEWRGPMPKLVEQAHDVRGWARGRATFYSDHFIIADEVLAWTIRSVGPDVDLLGRLLRGPARIALAGEREFRDWALPADGAMSFIPPRPGAAMFPAAAAFPLKLGPEAWWLKVLVLLRYPSPPQTPTSAFAWQCPHGLTASHDFRCAPTQPGQEYAFTIAVSWQPGQDAQGVERGLLAWRDAWVSPMRIDAVGGEPVSYRSARDEPREAMSFDSCFDRAAGRHVISAHDPKLVLRLDPRAIPRHRPVFAFRTVRADAIARCLLADRPLQPERDYLVQRAAAGELWLQLLATIGQPTTVSIDFEAP